MLFCGPMIVVVFSIDIYSKKLCSKVRTTDNTLSQSRAEWKKETRRVDAQNQQSMILSINECKQKETCTKANKIKWMRWKMHWWKRWSEAAAKFTDCFTVCSSYSLSRSSSPNEQALSKSTHGTEYSTGTHTNSTVRSATQPQRLKQIVEIECGSTAQLIPWQNVSSILFTISHRTSNGTHGEVAHTIIIYVKDRKYNKNDHEYLSMHFTRRLTRFCLFSLEQIQFSYWLFDGATECVSLRSFNSINATRY